MTQENTPSHRVNVSISAKDFDLTPAIKELVETKLAKLEKFSSRIERIGVEFQHAFFVRAVGKNFYRQIFQCSLHKIIICEYL